jgi:hypothetical protein
MNTVVFSGTVTVRGAVTTGGVLAISLSLRPVLRAAPYLDARTRRSAMTANQWRSRRDMIQIKLKPPYFPGGPDGAPVLLAAKVDDRPGMEKMFRDAALTGTDS